MLNVKQKDDVINLERFFKPQFKFKKPVDEIDQAIQAFLTGAVNGKFGRYYIHDDLFVYKVAVTDEIRISTESDLPNFIKDVESGKYELINCSIDDLKKEQRFHSIKYRTTKANVIAQRINARTYVGNSAALSLIGRTVAFGNESLNRDITPVQERLSRIIPMIPFNVFKQANLDLSKFRMIDKGSDETIVRSIRTGKYDKKNKPIFKDETMHFTGASLFEVDGQQFLFDIDRREIENKIFNAFLVKLPVQVKTIVEAYACLKPAEVIAAEKQGLKVLRQGEWFFIPVKGDFKHDTRRDRFGDGKIEPMPFELRAGRNRPNHAQFGNAAKGYVKGLITHSGREHAPLKLPQWHKPVPNTATESFTITGDVD